MVILSKKSLITLSVLINTQRQSGERISVEIGDEEIIFRGRSCRTEVTTNQAKMYPARMANCISCLFPDVYSYELDKLVAELIECVRGV